MRAFRSRMAEIIRQHVNDAHRTRFEILVQSRLVRGRDFVKRRLNGAISSGERAAMIRDTWTRSTAVGIRTASQYFIEKLLPELLDEGTVAQYTYGEDRDTNSDRVID